MNRSTLRWITLTLLVLIIATCLGHNTSAAQETEVALKFTIDNRLQLESLNASSVIQISDAGSAFPDNATLLLAIYRSFPTLHQTQENEDSQTEIPIHQWRLSRMKVGFSGEYKLPEINNLALPPGTYRVQLSFFRAQRQPLRGILDALDTRPTSEHILVLGSKAEVLKSILQDVDTLTRYQAKIADYSKRFQAHFRTFAAGSIDSSVWNSLSNEDYMLLEQDVMKIQNETKYAAMADAYSSLLDAYEYFMHYQLGIIAYDLNGPGSGGEQSKSKLKNADLYCGYLKPELPELIIEGSLMRQLPMNLIFILQGSITTLRSQYQTFLANPTTTQKDRVAFETDINTMLQHATTLHDRFKKRYGNEQSKTLVSRLKAVPVPSFADHRIIEQHRKDAELFTIEMNREEESFMEKLNSYMERYNTLYLACQTAVENESTWEKLESDFNEQETSLKTLADKINTSLQAKSPEPTAPITKETGIRNQPPEEETPETPDTPDDNSDSND